MNAEADRAAVTAALARAQQLSMRHFFHRRIVQEAEGQRPLFLAPHPDDIVVGCGGVLLQYCRRGAPARLVYLTDGRAAAARASDEEEMARVRRREAESVARSLMLEPPLFLACNEREFTAPERRAGLVEALAAELLRFAPDVVFVPYLFDQHADHRYACSLLAEATSRSGYSGRVMGYEVWSFAPPGYVVDISAQRAGKRDLIALYPSQVALFDYPAFAAAVGAAHAALVGPDCRAAEVFCPFSAAGFVAEVNRHDLTSPAALQPGVLLTPPDPGRS